MHAHLHMVLYAQSVTSEAVLGSKSVLAKLSSKFVYSGINVSKLQVSNHGRVNFEASVENVVDGLTVTVKAAMRTNWNHCMLGFYLRRLLATDIGWWWGHVECPT